MQVVRQVSVAGRLTGVCQAWGSRHSHAGNAAEACGNALTEGGGRSRSVEEDRGVERAEDQLIAIGEHVFLVRA